MRLDNFRHRCPDCDHMRFLFVLSLSLVGGLSSIERMEIGWKANGGFNASQVRWTPTESM